MNIVIIIAVVVISLIAFIIINLVWGTFILGILTAIYHFFTNIRNFYNFEVFRFVNKQCTIDI